MGDESVVIQHNMWASLTFLRFELWVTRMQDLILYCVHGDQLPPTRNLHGSNLVKGISRLVI